jgi:hypothetical protein
MAETPVTLDFLAAQQQRILDEMASMRADIRLIRDDIGVLSAMAMR